MILAVNMEYGKVRVFSIPMQRKMLHAALIELKLPACLMCFTKP